jgi:hypothetical protein
LIFIYLSALLFCHLSFGIWDLLFGICHFRSGFSVVLLVTLCYKYESTAMPGQEKRRRERRVDLNAPFALFRMREKAPGAL